MHVDTGSQIGTSFAAEGLDTCGHSRDVNPTAGPPCPPSCAPSAPLAIWRPCIHQERRTSTRKGAGRYEQQSMISGNAEITEETVIHCVLQSLHTVDRYAEKSCIDVNMECSNFMMALAINSPKIR